MLHGGCLLPARGRLNEIRPIGLLAAIRNTLSVSAGDASLPQRGVLELAIGKVLFQQVPQRMRIDQMGFVRNKDSPDDYRMLADSFGGQIHLSQAVEGWLVPGRNPFGLYLYREDVDGLAAVFRGEIPGDGGPSDKPWGMYEFALNAPDDVLIRVGWPTRLR